MRSVFSGAIVCFFAWMWMLSGCAAPERSGWIGLNTSVYQPAEATARPVGAENLSRTFALVDELDVPFVRDAVMNWALLQPQPDMPPDFAAADAYVRAAGKVECEILAVFEGVPGWALDRAADGAIVGGLPSRRHASAFAAFVSAFVERYDGDGRDDARGLTLPVRAYQFVCEMEHTPPHEYAFWLELFHRSVKQADPTATVVLGGLRSPGVPFFDEVGGEYPRYFERLLGEPDLQGPAYPCFDVVAFHGFPVRYPGRPPFDEAVAYLRQVMVSHKFNRPIWLTAFGHPARDMRDAEQAEQLVKCAVRARALGVERIYWYGLLDRAGAGPAMMSHCGLLRETDGQFVPKPAFEAFDKLIAEATDRPDVAMRGEGLYVFTGRGEPRYVVWKEETHDPPRLFIPGWWQTEPLSGPKMVRQGSEIRITRSPQFLERTTSPFIR